MPLLTVGTHLQAGSSAEYGAQPAKQQTGENWSILTCFQRVFASETITYSGGEVMRILSYVASLSACSCVRHCLSVTAVWPRRQGPNLLDTSSELIHQGEVSKLTSSSWSKELVTLFLFDHVLIYCRKDLLKRSVHQFRGRINLDTAQVVDLTDGKGQLARQLPLLRRIRQCYSVTFPPQSFRVTRSVCSDISAY